MLTNNRIKVTVEMMAEADMTRWDQLGVPDKKGGLIWKGLSEMTDDDFEDIEDYFLKQANS